MSTSSASRFLLLGEPLALDLVNTRCRRHGAALDLLGTPAALAAWLRQERERVAWTGPATHADLEAVCALRDSIALLLDALQRHARPPATALQHLNAALRNGQAIPAQFDWVGARLRQVAPKARTRRSVLLHALAAAAAALLTGPDAERVRQCAHPDCILRFVATNPRRRWCRDATCGNRARVARHWRSQHQAH